MSHNTNKPKLVRSIVKRNPYLVGVTFTHGKHGLLAIEAERPTDLIDDPNSVCRDCLFMTAHKCPSFAHPGQKYDCKLHKIIFTRDWKGDN
jgi:hypothetical protein